MVSNERKKTIKIIIYSVVIIILFLSIMLLVLLYKRQEGLMLVNRDIKKHNIEFEKYNREIKGKDITSLINYTVDHNKKEINKTKEKIKEGETFNKNNEDLKKYTEYINDSSILDEYKDNNYSTVNIELILKKNTAIPMENIIKNDIENFILYLSDSNFKPYEIRHHKNGKISYMSFKMLSDESINNEEIVENIE